MVGNGGFKPYRIDGMYYIIATQNLAAPNSVTRSPHAELRNMFAIAEKGFADRRKTLVNCCPGCTRLTGSLIGMSLRGGSFYAQRSSGEKRLYIISKWTANTSSIYVALACRALSARITLLKLRSPWSRVGWSAVDDSFKSRYMYLPSLKQESYCGKKTVTKSDNNYLVSNLGKSRNVEASDFLKRKKSVH